MTISTALSQGNAIQLGPVTVKKVFDMKPGDKQRFLIVTDPSGEGALKIWGAAANTKLFVGQSFTLIGAGPKGGIKAQEYPVGSGKWSLNANDCRLEIDGQAPGGHTDHQNAPQGRVEHVGYNEPTPFRQEATGPSGDKLEATMKRAAKATALYIDELVVNHGFSKDEAIMLAQGSHSVFPLFWFGEKGLM